MSEREDPSSSSPPETGGPDGKAQPPSGGGREAVSSGRRRLLRGAVTGAPLIMTVAGRPAFGAVCSPSQFASGNASPNGNEDCTAGFTPGGWKKVNPGDGNWDRTGFVPGGCEKLKEDGTCAPGRYLTPRGGQEPTPFFGIHTFTSFGGRFTQAFQGLTLYEVLWLEGHRDPAQFGAHIVAALLNATALTGYGLEPKDVKKIFAEMDQYGSYEPLPGTTWSTEEVVAYLQATMVVS